MSDYLSEGGWKTEEKNHKKVSNTGISEPLRDYAKAKAKRDDKAQTGALMTLISKAQVAQGKHKDNVKLIAYLTEMVAAAKSEIKALAEGGDALADHLKAAKSTPRYFAVALGKPPALVLARRPVQGPALADVKKAGGNGTTLTGTCEFVDGKYVFSFEDKPPSGAASKIAKAVLRETKLKIQVKARGGGVELDDENDVDHDDSEATTDETRSAEDAGSESESEGEGARSRSGSESEAEAEGGRSGSESESESQDESEQEGEKAYKTARAEAMAVLNGLRGTVGFDMKAAVKEVEKAKAIAGTGDYKTAVENLNELARRGRSESATESTPESESEAGPSAAVRKTAQAWNLSAATATKGVSALQIALLKTKDPRAATIARALVGTIDGPAKGVGAALEAVAKALEAGDPLADPVADLSAAYDDCLAALKSEMVADAESNPFVKVELKKALVPGLADVRKRIGELSKA